jgi:hypothetical protein
VAELIRMNTVPIHTDTDKDTVSVLEMSRCT